METVLLTFAVLVIFVLIMSVGVLMGRKPIKGSCGGVGAALGETEYICPMCGDDPNKCDEIKYTGKTDEKGISYEAK